MAMQRSPDGRLVYLHCSSIFSGANAHVQKAKTVSQLLEQHKASIKTLTKEFALPAVAAVAKKLLEEQIFESLPRAKLRYPELFQPSEIQKAERAVSEAEVVRVEAEATQDIALTSDEEGGDECLASEQGEQGVEIKGTLEDNAEAGDSQQSTSQAHNALSIPKLHPVYLPFKTQHSILVSVQDLLQECCLEFGNTWVPDLMEARQWNEAESIELTEWTKRFLKHAESLPASAIKWVPGKSIAEVLLGTSTLRHSAVHRLPTNAAGIMNMLSSAITFAEALQDLERAERIAEIRTQLQASIKEIVQHQNLLQRKITDQFEDIARRRAELDELERSSIEEMLATDKKQRIEVGSALESFLDGFRQVSNNCTCSHKVNLAKAEVDSEVEENSEESWIIVFLYALSFFSSLLCSYIHSSHSLYGNRGTRIHDQSPHGDKDSHQGVKVDTRDQPDCHDSTHGSIETELEVSELTLSTSKSEGQKKIWKKAAASGWKITTAEEASLHVDEAATSKDESHITAQEEEPLPKDAFRAEGAVSKEDLMEKEKTGPEATLEVSPAEPIIEGFDRAEKDTFNQHDNYPAIDDPSMPGPDVTPTHSAPAENSTFLEPSPKPSPYVERNKSDSHSPPPPTAPSSTVTSIAEALAPKAPTKDSHTIALKILNGGRVLRSIISIHTCTRTAILNEARAYCVKTAQDVGVFLPMGWDLTLVSLVICGYNLDLLIYKVEDLTPVVRSVEKSGMPRFTLRMSES